MKRKLAILLATYNGERYLQEQIDSLYRQTYKDWVLYIHDDGSTDGTCGIISKNAAEHGNIVVMEHQGGHGAKDNFFGMLERVDADYYMFCDQDDVWLEDKVEKSLKRMHEVERSARGGEIPVVVHCDLFVVDEGLNLINDSFWRYAGIDPDYLVTFNRVSQYNLATGCTMLINAKAKAVAMAYPYENAHMHDSWITACVFKDGGRVSAIKEQLIYYRQHSKNCIGASNAKRHSVGFAYLLKNIKSVYQKNKVQYLPFRSLGCPLWVYVCNKILYRVMRRA